MNSPKGTVIFVAMVTILLAAGLITLPSSILTPVSSAAKSPSDNEGPADVDIQILASKPRRAVKVAILSSSHFYARNIDPASVTLAGVHVMKDQSGGFKAAVKDVNDDGLSDLILQFPSNVLNIGAGPTKVSLEGQTYAGAGIRGVNCLQPSGEPCGGTIIPVTERDTVNAGRVKKPRLQASTLAVTFSENFDAVTAPALPAGWPAITAIDCANSDPWATSSAGTPTPPADTPPNAAFVNDPSCISDERLHSPPIPIVGTAASLTFRQNRSLENSFDGGVLEVSTDGGASFADILVAGGTFATGGYNGTISVNFGSPIGGRQAWTGSSGGFVTTTVNFPASFSGQSIILRWRRATDSSDGSQGWRVDTISIDDVADDCVLTCPANVTQDNDPNQCGAVVNYPAPTTTGDCGNVNCSPSSGSFFPVGTTTITCQAAAGPSCSFTVTVNDTEPTVISGASANPSSLWPPNHKMVDVTVSYTSTDNCGGMSNCVLSVTSNEPVSGTGDGDKSPDWIIVNDHLVQLRAERAEGGSGRIYTITITCTDSAGNSSSTTVTVTVPHNL